MIASDPISVGRMWEESAGSWTKLARQGCDVFRDSVNTPAFLAMLPDVTGKSGIDIGCGEGYNTRLVAERSARMTAIDISPTLIRHAAAEEPATGGNTRYCIASALALPFADASFDFAIATMSLMGFPNPGWSLREIRRVLRPGGFLQFSISHPCFTTPRWKWVRDKSGEKIGVVCGDYFDFPEVEMEEWSFNAAPAELRRETGRFRIPQFSQTLSSWMNLILDCGFSIERLDEPHATPEAILKEPRLRETRMVAYVLTIRARKLA